MVIRSSSLPPTRAEPAAAEPAPGGAGRSAAADVNATIRRRNARMAGRGVVGLSRYAVVIGEALVDLLEAEIEGDRLYRPAIGGAPLNVAVGVARLGAETGVASEFVGSLGNDSWAERIKEFLAEAGVGTRGVVTADVATTLAMTTYDGAEPDFSFYGSPPSYGVLGDIDPALVAGAGVLYCGSICLLCDRVLEAARVAWASPGPIKTFDPNIRPRLGADMSFLRQLVADFARGADLVKLSAADAVALWDEGPDDAARRVTELGAGAVVVTLGGQGALVAHNGRSTRVPPPAVDAIDTTGAGDATMAGLLWGILAHGLPGDLAEWTERTRFAVAVAGLVCESAGGATSMPTLSRLRQRFGDELPNLN
jgi:fructokinase